MMDMGVHRTSLIEGNAVPKDGRLSLRDARKSALVRRNGALERLVENIRSLISFSSNLSRSSKAKSCCTIKYNLLIRDLAVFVLRDKDFKTNGRPAYFGRNFNENSCSFCV
jgi:hypothetical protein